MHGAAFKMRGPLPTNCKSSTEVLSGERERGREQDRQPGARVDLMRCKHVAQLEQDARADSWMETSQKERLMHGSHDLASSFPVKSIIRQMLP